MRIQLALIVDCALFIALISGCSSSGAPGTSPGAPAVVATPLQPGPQALPSPGTSWIYDNTLTSTSVWATKVPLTGQLGITFNGVAQYRGSNYESATAFGGAFANAVTTYYTWTGTNLLENAETDALLPVIPGCVAPKRETILTQPPQFMSVYRASGSAALYQCSAANGSLNWSLSVTDGGAAVTTVPAGTFQTHAWNASWRFGNNERDYTIYMFGNDIIERDATELNSGIPFASYSIKLRSGPTGAVIPSAPIVYSYDF